MENTNIVTNTNHGESEVERELNTIRQKLKTACVQRQHLTSLLKPIEHEIMTLIKRKWKLEEKIVGITKLKPYDYRKKNVQKKQQRQQRKEMTISNLLESLSPEEKLSLIQDLLKIQ